MCITITAEDCPCPLSNVTYVTDNCQPTAIRERFGQVIVSMVINRRQTETREFKLSQMLNDDNS